MFTEREVIRIRVRLPFFSRAEQQNAMMFVYLRAKIMHFHNVRSIRKGVSP